MSLIQVTKLVNQIDLYVRANTGDLHNRHQTISALLGTVIGIKLAIPAEAVKNVKIHYHERVYMSVVDTLNQINEAHPIDLDVAMQSAYYTWLDRYKIVHPAYLNVGDVMSRLAYVQSNTKTQAELTLTNKVTTLFSQEDGAALSVIINELVTELNNRDED